MNIFTIDVTQNELAFIRQSLDFVSVSGKDAKFLANLQVKIENELIQIQEMLAEEERKKQEQLQEIIQEDITKTSNKKK